jgi:hypothetical protein
MKRLDELRTAIKQELEAVLEGLRILAGIAQPREVAVAADPVPATCPFCRQLVRQTMSGCGACRRKLAPGAAG